MSVNLTTRKSALPDPSAGKTAPIAANGIANVGKTYSAPFRIEGPALISFSGGRTSAYMLWRILQVRGGTLPEDVHVCFANTGKEREETLRFVHDCATRWNVRVRWLEWRRRERAALALTKDASIAIAGEQP